ncbi:ferredoxin-NADP reductase [Curtobacterium sp. PhB130]|uniref:FAD-binding oxidoreductase n=1 Tax=Curtobacterium sp. PhB130 TaxID=2485178 RepID=UPI000FA98533|nr:FAD-binding oxidoreductase [Curtobacterium sp. PhB130]ROS73839.1 ferredoxin-NADP reductase [Curtobacterium sp. PhB130]
MTVPSSVVPPGTAGLEAGVGSAPSAPPRRRPAWHAATVAAVSPETPTARRIVLDVPTWPGNDPGQHLDLRLTAEDGYQATRSYSIASAGDSTMVTLAVDRVDDGEVSPFLVDAVEVGDALDVHGPLGGWFVWRPDAAAPTRPVQLIAGGSGIVPLAAMVAAHTEAEDPTPFRLLYAVRTPDDVFFRSTLDAARAGTAPFTDAIVYSRRAPDPSLPVGRLTRDVLAAAVFPPDAGALVYVCGSTPFVEQVLRWLGELGHDTTDVRAERFGGN